MKLEKEKLFNLVVVNSSYELGLSNTQSQQLFIILNKTFMDIELETSSCALDTEVVRNDILIRNFIGCKKLGGIKDSSIQAYVQTLKQFLDFRELVLLKTTTDDVRRFLLDYERKVSKRTADNARRNLNSFFQFLEDDGYIIKNPVKKIKQIKDPERIKKFYTDLEMEEMRDCCQNKRELAMVDFLMSTGLRVSELSNAKISDIDWNERMISVIGKGDKQRIIPFSQRANKHLQAYLNSRNGDSEYLFCGYNSPYNKLSKYAINSQIKKIGSRAGLPNITVHCFRRWFASDLCKKGVDIEVIQYILGHSSFQTTSSYYIKNNIDKVKHMHNIYAN